ncbi:MAG: hypothetical protein WCD44_02995 [Candidatus Babeliales bacterium]
MKKNKKGFLLLSFFIYLLLFSFLIVLSFDWIITFFKNHFIHANRNATLVNMCTAQDLLVRDIHQTPRIFHEWKKITPSEIIWSITNQNKDIGWCFKNKKLFRNEGSYSKQKQKWNKKTTSLAVQQLNNVVFTVNKQLGTDKPSIKNITIEYTASKMKPTIEIISLQNRVIG